MPVNKIRKSPGTFQIDGDELVGHARIGVDDDDSKLKYNPVGTTLPVLCGGLNFEGLTNTLANATGSSHFQSVTTTVPAAAGSSTGASPSRMGSYFAYLTGSALTATANRTVAIHGVYGITSTNASTWEKAAIEGEVHSSTTTADAAIIAVLGGDDGKTTAGAAFMVQNQNSLVGTKSADSGFDYGLDMYPAAIVGTYKNTFKKADVRMTNDVCLFSISGTDAPTNGTSGTGAGFAGPGSLCVTRGNGKWYTNTNTTASPTWTLVGSQS